MADSYPTTDRSFALRVQSSKRASGPVTRALAALRADHPDEPATRRGFLRALTALPMIGGGVALIGSPEAVAEPVTKDLLIGYSDWLLLERRILLHEMFPDPAERRFARDAHSGRNRKIEEFHLGPGYPISWQSLPMPSTRAALVLSAVGCDWH